VRHPDASLPFPFYASRNCAIVARPGEINAARTRRSRAWAISMTKETTPLWVWLSVALLAIGGFTYAVTVYFVEYIIGFF
jgi:uncharacterized membrane protein